MKWLAAILIVSLLGVGGWWGVRAVTAGPPAPATVTIRRGNVVHRAVAVGRIEPDHEIPIKSETGGIAVDVFVRAGDKVKRGDPLVEVRPRVTERSEVEAERAIKAADDAMATADDLLEGRTLLGKFMGLMQGRAALARMRRGVALQRTRAREQLDLLRRGSVEVEGRKVDWILRAPAGGHVLAVSAREGDPIVPSSSYGSGTVMMTLADLDRPVFRGTVDEIDVGRLRAGMTARVRVGALPDANVTGVLDEIALKSKTRNNAVVFDVTLRLTTRDDVLLRAGYSAVAEIEIARATDVVVVPERVVTFRDGAATVRVRGAGDRTEIRAIELGLSDGLTAEVRTGLVAGEVVLERTYR